MTTVTATATPTIKERAETYRYSPFSRNDGRMYRLAPVGGFLLIGWTQKFIDRFIGQVWREPIPFYDETMYFETTLPTVKYAMTARWRRINYKNGG
jgi:hypothetical protein